MFDICRGLSLFAADSKYNNTTSDDDYRLPQSRELQVITDVAEWRYFRQQYGSNAPLTQQLFTTSSVPSSDASSASAHAASGGPAISTTMAMSSAIGKTPTVVIDRNRTVHIPFKFQSFACGAIGPNAELTNEDGTTITGGGEGKAVAAALAAGPAYPMYPGSRVVPNYAPIRARPITVSIETLDRVVVAVLRVIVKPQGFIVDRTFRFHHRGNEILQNVCVPLGSETGGAGRIVTFPGPPGMQAGAGADTTFDGTTGIGGGGFRFFAGGNTSMAGDRYALNASGVMQNQSTQSLAISANTTTVNVGSGGGATVTGGAQSTLIVGQVQNNYHVQTRQKIVTVRCTNDEVLIDIKRPDVRYV